MLPSSFCAEDEGYTVDLREKTIEQAWLSEEFEMIRNKMKDACPDCPHREFCMGGCPMIQEIVICSEKVKTDENKD